MPYQNTKKRTQFTLTFALACPKLGLKDITTAAAAAAVGGWKQANVVLLACLCAELTSVAMQSEC